VTNPPPSAGGILIAHALALLGGADAAPDVAQVVEVMERTQAERTPAFLEGLDDPAYVKRFLARRSPLGSTTHVSVLDREGWACSVTSSNGSSSGVVVPGTGVHLNNMLGEYDLVAGGPAEPGRRLTSMMAPSVVLGPQGPRLVVGSAGSVRLRGAIMQVIANVVARGLGVGEAIEAPRVHVEEPHVHCEGGFDERELDRLVARGYDVVRWRRRNLYFGGTNAVEVRPDGTLDAAGDSRRGGAGVVVSA
jgi:gamma-glutamyltranspeptidase/glutathione hydrolase